MSAIQIHHTPTTERSWDGPATTAAAPADRALLGHMHAWVNPDGDPETKAAYALPHHGPRSASPAVVPAVRNALARLPQSRIPEADRAAVGAHLQAHLEDANN